MDIGMSRYSQVFKNIDCEVDELLEGKRSCN